MTSKIAFDAIAIVFLVISVLALLTIIAAAWIGIIIQAVDEAVKAKKLKESEGNEND